MICRCRRIFRGPLIADISYIAPIVISMVVNMLDSTIWKIHRVGSIHIASTIRGLSSSKGSTRVLIMHPILILVWSWLLFIHWLRSMVCWDMMSYRGMIARSWSMVNNRGLVGRSCVYNRGMVCRGMVYHRSMVCRGWGMAYYR